MTVTLLCVITRIDNGSLLQIMSGENSDVSDDCTLCIQGDRLSVGVATCCVTRKSDGKSVGGYAAEYEGTLSCSSTSSKRTRYQHVSIVGRH